MNHLDHLIERYPELDTIRQDIDMTFNIIIESFANGRKLLVAGNGGSAADAEHIVSELMKNFVKKRNHSNVFIDDLNCIDSEIAQYLIPRLQPALPAITLSSHISLNTAAINDIDGNIIFAQQVYGYGKKDDVFLGISTSGNAKNVLYAAVTAKAKKMKVIALTGSYGGALRQFADACIAVPEVETYKIQELHLPVYHCLCLMLEEYFF